MCVLGSATETARNESGGSPRLMQEPMIGPVSESEIVIWGRVSGPYPFAVEYGREPDLSDGVTCEALEARAEVDYTVVLRLSGLEPGTTYYCRPLVRGTGVSGLSRKRPFAVKTAPAVGKRARFTVAYGSCAEWTEDRVQPIWKHVQEAEPDLFFFLDCRYYRDPDVDPDGPGKTMLGKKQLAWLKWELKTSRAPFEVLISGSGWNSLEALHQPGLVVGLSAREGRPLRLHPGRGHRWGWCCSRGTSISRR